MLVLQYSKSVLLCSAAAAGLVLFVDPHPGQTLNAAQASAAPQIVEQSAATPAPFSTLPAYLLRTYQFADTAGQTRIEVRTGLVRDVLQFVKDRENSYRGSYEISLAIFDVREACVADRTWHRDLQTTAFAATNDRAQLHEDRAVFHLPAGDYRLHVEIVDRHTQRRLRRKYPLTVQNLQNGSLQISTLMLGEVLLDSAGVARMSSHNLPGILKLDAPRQSVYYEIYGAATGASVLIDYAITSWEGDTLTAWNKTVIAAGQTMKIAEGLAGKVRHRGSHSLHVRVKTNAQAAVAKIAFKVQAAIPETAHSISAADVLYYAPLEYVSSAREYQIIAASTAEARDSLVAAFWQQRDPTPGSARNELQNEFYRRVAEAETGFAIDGEHQPGWRSDRGRIYIIHGPPREVQTRMNEEDALIYEIWLYPEIGRRFIFRERDSSGRFELINR